MRLSCVLAVAALFGVPAVAISGRPADTLVIINRENAFRRFWNDARGQRFDVQVLAWKNDVEALDPGLYDSLVWGNPADKNWSQRRLARLRQSFEEYSRLEQGILTAFHSFRSTAVTQYANFLKHFPDMEFRGPIYAIPSTKFNGKAGMLEPSKKLVLAFGMDVVARNHDRMDVLFAHELFHLYHLQRMGIPVERMMTESRLTLPLWFEGFATYVSGVLTPAATDSALLFDPALGSLPADSVPNLAAEFLECCDESMVEAEKTHSYDRWFSASSVFGKPGRPARCGYALGLFVVRQLVKDHALTELTRWHPDEVHRHVVEVLRRVAHR